MNRLRTLLGEDGTVLLDGGMGTLLQEQGLDDGGSGELWNVERPDVIAGLHEEYAKAGARILTTNTFGGTRPRLEMHGLADRLHELNRAGAAVATEVARRHGILVAGDLGPTGELLAPLGTMEPAQAQELFEEQLVALRDGGIDVVLIETMSDLGEVEAAVAAARQVVPDLPVIATLSFDTNLRTMMGVRPADAVTQPGRARGGRGRRQLRPRTGRDGGHRRAAHPGTGGRGADRRASPTPACRSWSATGSSTTSRPTSSPTTPGPCKGSASTSSGRAAAPHPPTSPRWAGRSAA